MRWSNYRCKAMWPIVMLLLACFALPLYSQTATLKGKVTDKATGEILPGANVVVQAVGSSAQPTGAATGEDGSYSVPGLSAGTYFVAVSFIGYARQEFSSINLTAGETKTLDVALEPTGINVNAITVSASRRPEKVLEAPAAIQVIESAQIEARNTLTPIEHLKGLPAVDIVQTGLTQSNVVVRGFNNIFSGALLTLTDNRIARVPSLRLNAFNFIPATNEDIERAEVVFGPGSALYGPNSANGVFHILTKSPFGSEGTQISVGGGFRSSNKIGRDVFDAGSGDVLSTSFRYASSFNDKIGFKISAQYYQGDDWENTDRLEPARLQKQRQTATGPVAVGDSVDNVRDFGIKKLSGEARLDWLLNDETTLILNGGFNRSSNLDLTGIGAAQAIDWTYSFVQARLTYKDLFLQGFVNMSDAGDTFLLNTGDLIADNSKLFVGQLQHGLTLGDKQRFTYGFDALFTRPNTDNTINGRFEKNDDINEIGVYLQSETSLSQKLNLVLAARVDDHNRLDGLVFSPRAGIVFKPSVDDNFRVTYNRAFSTPTSNNLFLDINSVLDVFGLGASIGPLFPFEIGTDVRAQGVPESGFNFSVDQNGAQFRSPFAPLDPRQLTRSDFISQHDPIFTNVMWGVAHPLVTAGLEAQFRPVLIGLGLSDGVINQLFDDVKSTIIPAQVADVKNTLQMLNTETLSFEPFSGDPFDIARIKPTITQTFEAGYKGIIGEKLVLNASVYYSKITDFVGPLTLETPNVFLDQSSLFTSLLPQFQENISNSNNSLLLLALSQLDSPDNGGNGNGSPADELAGLYAQSAAGIPFGTVTPKEALDPTDMILTYRNFGDINFWGGDMSLTYFPNNMWSVTGNYAYVSKDKFPKSATQPHNIFLNAARNKAGAVVRYSNRNIGFNGEIRYRFVDSFPMDSGPYKGTVESYNLIDLNLDYEVIKNTRLSLTITNVFDKKHRQIIGAPEIGRLALLKVTQTF